MKTNINILITVIRFILSVRKFRCGISEAWGYGTVLAWQRGTTPRVPETDSERRGRDELGPQLLLILGPWELNWLNKPGKGEDRRVFLFPL